MNQRVPWEAKLRDWVGRMETGMQRSVEYVNDRMVPVVRREALETMHAVAMEVRVVACRCEARLAAAQARAGGRS